MEKVLTEGLFLMAAEKLSQLKTGGFQENQAFISQKNKSWS